ncbi:hypothetical protein BKK47_02380 [Rodentibacter mrazii]|uniref:Uncharacterized protein n=1 Tax=Rodentibacter mrazii TaxID=1908257 RepID=A0A1V3IIG8_9PAST|nr:hypothetical protein [Rodentibacter mrazii]OOF40975.1 hypothetical protein BKK47_02380 [Rodentibacter mrazii]
MKKLFQVLFTVFFFMGSNTVAASQNKNATTKQAVKQTKQTQAKKTIEKKTTKKVVEKKKAAQKKSVTKVSKTTAKNQASTGKKVVKSQLVKNQKKEKKKAEKMKKTVQTVSAKKIEKVENQAHTSKNTQTKQTPKAVIVPKCQDNHVAKVLSDAFKQQGQVTATQMTVKQIRQVYETQYYPQQSIRSCHALVETQGKQYQTDYSVILNGNGFFVQVENAQAMR